MGAPGRAFPNFGGPSPAAIAEFPQAAGWRVITGGLVVPPRKSTVCQVTTSVPAAGTAFATVPVNMGQGVVTVPAPITLPKNSGILFELAALSLRDNTADTKNVSVAAAALFLSQATAADAPLGTTIPILLPILPPTLNVVRGASPSNIYSLAAPYAVHFDDLNQAQVMAGGAPLTGLVDLFFLVVMDNTAAGAHSIIGQAIAQWRLFEGVTTS